MTLGEGGVCSSRSRKGAWQNAPRVIWDKAALHLPRVAIKSWPNVTAGVIENHCAALPQLQWPPRFGYVCNTIIVGRRLGRKCTYEPDLTCHLGVWSTPGNPHASGPRVGDGAGGKAPQEAGETGGPWWVSFAAEEILLFWTAQGLGHVLHISWMRRGNHTG